MQGFIGVLQPAEGSWTIEMRTLAASRSGYGNHVLKCRTEAKIARCDSLGGRRETGRSLSHPFPVSLPRNVRLVENTRRATLIVWREGKALRGWLTLHLIGWLEGWCCCKLFWLDGSLMGCWRVDVSVPFGWLRWCGLRFCPRGLRARSNCLAVIGWLEVAVCIRWLGKMMLALMWSCTSWLCVEVNPEVPCVEMPTWCWWRWDEVARSSHLQVWIVTCDWLGLIGDYRWGDN